MPTNYTNSTIKTITGSKVSVPLSSTESGVIQVVGTGVVGVGTSFSTEMPAGSWLVKLSANEFRRVNSVVSNTLAYLDQAFTADFYPVSITYSNLIGTFTVGEVVEGADTGDTGVVVSDSGTVLVLKDVTGEFTAETVITGNTSGATADVDSIALNEPEVIPTTRAIACEISVIIPLGNSAGTITTTEDSALPAGLPVNLSKVNRDSSGPKDLVNPCIIDATGTVAMISIIY